MDDPVLEQHFVGHRGTITSLSFSPSEKQLLSSSEDHTFMNWNLTSSSGSLRYKAKALPFSHVCFSPNGNYIASSQGQFVRLWVSSIRGKSTEFRTHFGIVRSVQFSPDGDNLLTASDDKSLKIWATSKRKFLSSLSGNNGHTNWVRFGTYSPDGHLIVSCSDDRTIKLWDSTNSKIIHTFHELRGVPRFVQFHPSNQCIGVAMATGTVKIYDLKMMKLLQYYPCHEGTVNALSFHPNGTYLITAGNDYTCKMIDLVEGRAILSLEGHQKAVTSVNFSTSGKLFATASADKNVFVWKTKLCENAYENDITIKESITDENIAVPRLTTSPLGHGSATEITEVYCAKDYEENKINDELNLEDIKTSHLELNGGLMSDYPSEGISPKELSENANVSQSTFNELTSKITVLTNKMANIEYRLTQIEQNVKSKNESE